MEQFDLLRLGHFVRKIGRLRCVCSQEIYSFDTLENVTGLLCLCEELAKYCGAVGFRNAESEAILLLGRIRQRTISLAGSALEARLDTLERMLIDDARKSKYFQMSSEDAEYLNPLLVFGLSATGPFPSASIDFQDACSCIAFGMWTAAVFHLMRIVEYGLRAFAADVGLSDVLMNQLKAKTVPIAYAEWDRILTQLPEKVKAKIDAMPRGEEKQRAQEFYYPALEEFNGFKDAWRNHVTHTRKVYIREDAIQVLSHVKRFLNSLVDQGIAE
jgi:hypothetical protein